MSPRTSIGFGIRRWLTRRCLTTTSASAKAWSVPSLSPTNQSKTMLFGAFSWSCGAPGWVAFSASTTVGRGSQSTWIASSASIACSGVSATTAATPSPVHFTSSVARTRGVLTLFWIVEPPAGHAIGNGLYGMSAPVNTAMTPGRVFATDVSIDLIRAWAYGLRRMAMWAIPVSLMSSRKRPRPVMKRGSSVRLTEVPRTSAVIVRLLRRCAGRRGRGRGRRRRGACPHRRRGLADRRDDVLVARAPAVVALDRVPDLLVGWVGVPREKVGRDHDHSGGAEAALEPVLPPERGLQRVQLLAVPESLDCCDAFAIGLDGEPCARLDRLAVDGDGA